MIRRTFLKLTGLLATLPVPKFLTKKSKEQMTLGELAKQNTKNISKQDKARLTKEHNSYHKKSYVGLKIKRIFDTPLSSADELKQALDDNLNGKKINYQDVQKQTIVAQVPITDIVFEKDITDPRIIREQERLTTKTKKDGILGELYYYWMFKRPKG